MGADFSGYATKAGLKCSDGRTIMPDAFKHMDKVTVPLVWQHIHNDPENVLGHAVLEARSDGLYAYGYFNNTTKAQHVKGLVQHGDVTFMSIWANQLVEKAKQVFHGVIREVSLVLSGANPGALIDNVIRHSDGYDQTMEDEAIIYTGLTLEHQASPGGSTTMKTAQDVYDSLDQEQKDLVHFMIGEALKGVAATAAHFADGDGNSGDGNDGKTDGDDSKNGNSGEGNLKHKEGTGDVSRNVFEQNAGGTGTTDDKHVLTHADVKGIVQDAIKSGSLKQAVEAYALAHGIDNIDVLFPDAQAISNTPEYNKRRTEWVAGVLNDAGKTPFSRIKSLTADLTYDEARARGYITGGFKKEEYFSVSKRVTTPTTIYKKQRLDRDDIVDITDFDVVAWLKAEMRLMLDEELARAALIGDGRDVMDEDKIKDPAGATEGAGIRSIANDHELYQTTVYVNLGDASSSYTEVVEEVLRARRFYKGTGTPTFYTTEAVLTEMLLLKDGQNRRLYNSKEELAAAMRVADIVAVEVMDSEADLVGIIVNMADYRFGADRGGEVSMFDDFDIDYNQYKYLLETRVSGALTKIKAALVIRTTGASNVLVRPITAPTYDGTTYVVTIPTQTGVVYKNADTSATLTAGAQTALTAGQTLNVVAVPASGYYFASTAEDQWKFFRRA